MATLYEINTAILECVDTETGEIIDTERLQALQIEKSEKLENIALWYKNLKSDAEQYKAEKQAFDAKLKAVESKAESLKKLLDSELNGAPFKTARVGVSYRKSEAVCVDDISKIDDSYLKYAEPTPDKTAIKDAIKSGVKIDGAHIEERSNISIK